MRARLSHPLALACNAIPYLHASPAPTGRASRSPPWLGAAAMSALVAAALLSCENRQLNTVPAMSDEWLRHHNASRRPTTKGGSLAFAPRNCDPIRVRIVITDSWGRLARSRIVDQDREPCLVAERGNRVSSIAADCPPRAVCMFQESGRSPGSGCRRPRRAGTGEAGIGAAARADCPFNGEAISRPSSNAPSDHGRTIRRAGADGTARPRLSRCARSTHRLQAATQESKTRKVAVPDADVETRIGEIRKQFPPKMCSCRCSISGS